MFCSDNVCQGSYDAGPEFRMPFQSRIALTVLATATCLCDEISGKCGGIKFDHPSEPHTTLVVPLGKAVLATLRMLDSLTDLSVVSIVLEKVRGSPYSLFTLV